MTEMRQVYSSHVDEIGYDPETSELHVKYDTGRTAIYDGVPSHIASQVMSSASIGGALRQLVRGQYNHRYG